MGIGKIDLSKPTFLILFLVVTGIGLTIGAASAVMVFTESIEVNQTGGNSEVDIISSSGDATVTLETSVKEHAIVSEESSKKLSFNDVSKSKSRIVVRDNGKVGIGFATPTEKLHVAGNIKTPKDVIANDYVDTSNNPSGPDGTAIGGSSNTAGGDHSTVGGGLTNAANAFGSTVGGGTENIASGQQSTIGGGDDNAAGPGTRSTIGGGQSNIASGDDTTIGGGNSNFASSSGSTVGGGTNNGASIGWATVGGGDSNNAANSYATVGGGQNNRVGPFAIGFGGVHGTIGGGQENIANGENAPTVGGGQFNQALGRVSTIAGGNGNIADGIQGPTVGGGYFNHAGGLFSTVPGGISNLATGDYSFAAGRSARAEHIGSFVWSDSTSGPPANDPFESTADNQFAIRATGGVRIVGHIDCDGCIDAPDLAPGALILDGPFAASSSTSTEDLQPMISSTNSLCFLTNVQIAFADSTGTNKHCRIFESGGNWVLGARGESPMTLTCQARCFSWGS